ncbi:MAG: hypothetical protein ACI3ZL_07195 [Candidatus Cryptobacteroides sp.]
MKDTFNIRRFGKYFVSDLSSNAANFGLSLALISLMEVIVYLFVCFFSLMTSGEWSGPGFGLRCATLSICYIVLIVSMPVKCYGHITDLRSGSNWLMVPASTLEKFLSMVLNTAIVIPAIFGLVFVGADWLICTLDPSCGDSFCKIMTTLPGFVNEIPDIEAVNFVKKMMKPWLYIDDHIGMILIFLLGAICFKRNKSAKTLLAIIAVSMAVGMISGPLMLHYISENAGSIAQMDDPSILFGTSLFRNAAVWDTVNDCIIMVGILVAIYFRLKTLKH